MSRSHTFNKKTQDKFLKKPKKRKVNFRKHREYFLILCEGEKTEPNYFKSFQKLLPKDMVEVDIDGLGQNTLSIVKEAKKRKEERNNSHNPAYDKIWVVFDRDSFQADNFDNAIYSAEANGFYCAWSNEAFELWYILHFEYHNTGMSRTEYQRKLDSLLGRRYNKNDENMYDDLIGHQHNAIRNAEKLAIINQEIRSKARANPGTNVHTLVMELNSYIT